MKTLFKVIALQPGIRIQIYSDADLVEPRSILQAYGVEGITAYDARQILVFGGKEVRDLLRVLKHELTHLALDVVFQNRGRPYPKESTSVMEEKIASRWLDGRLEGDINKVFQNYGKSEWSAELMAYLMTELVLNGEREQTKDLLDFFRDHVKPACGEALVPM